LPWGVSTKETLMPDTSLALTSEQLDEFDRRGVIRLEALLSADRLRRVREHVQRRLALLGYWRNGEWHLDQAPRLKWPDRGLKTSRVVGNNHPDVDAVLEEPGLLAAIDTLLGGRPFDRTIHKRPQVLFTLPNAGPWTLPSGWHADGLRLASGGCTGVQLFSCVDLVDPRGGGTLVIAGSHRLFNLGRVVRSKEFNHFLRQQAFFRGLLGAEGSTAFADGGALPSGGIDGIDLEVIELTGNPGDSYLLDMRMLHTGAPNASARPRVMLTHRFFRADLVHEVAEAYGWATDPSKR
jgi:ectoine hydroxylase-related dioxygenase (phytanoyl-CoA dioxygenase family)